MARFAELAGAQRIPAHRIVAGCIAAALLGTAAPAAEPVPDPILETIEAADIASLALSPNGTLLAFRTSRPDVARNRYLLDWHVLDLASGHVLRIAGAGEAIIRDPGILVEEPPVWSPDGRWIYYRALEGGEIQLWRAAADGSSSEKVTDEAGDVELAGPALGQGIRLGIGPDRAEIDRAESEEYDRGILADAHVELAQNVFRGAIINGRHRSQRLTGTWFARGGILWDRPLRYRLLAFGSHRLSDLAGGDDAPAAGPGVRSASGDIATVERKEGRSILQVHHSRGSSTICAGSPCHSERISWLQWRPGHRQLIFAASDRAHAQSLWIWDLASGRVTQLSRSNGLASGGLNDEVPCAVTAKEAICVMAAAGAPPALEAIALDTGARRILFDPNATLRTRSWADIERLRWTDGEGRMFTAMMFLPRQASRTGLPLFLNYYRCDGFIRGGMGDEWPFAAMAEAGIVSVCINATRIEGPQDALGQYRAALSGIEALIAQLRRRGLIDPARVGIGGLSFGSEVAMWAVMHSSLIAAASVASPQLEPATYWFNGVPGRDYRERVRQVWGLGPPDQTPDRWRLISPALNTDRIQVPLLMQLPEQEARYALELHGRLRNSSTPIELYIFPDEPHIKVQPRHRLATYRRNLDWFRFWLMGVEDRDPAKAAQYRRWRELKARAGLPHRRVDESQSSSEARSKTRK